MTATVPAQRHSFTRLIINHNPFYLLSAACMLAGCLALTNTLSWEPVPLSRLLVLIVTLNVYEVLLIGLGLFLVVRRGLLRDGMMLLVLEALFLVDVALLNGEVFTIDRWMGLAVNAALFVAAVVKVTVVFRVLRLRLSGMLYPLVLLQLLVLFAMPGVFKFVSHEHDGHLPLGVLYATWWAVSAMPVLYVAMVGGLGRFAEQSGPAGTRLAGVLVVLPVLSMVLHLSTYTWVYKEAFFAANLSPVLLALAVLSKRMKPTTAIPASQLPAFRLILLGAAVVCSMGYPRELTLPLIWTGRKMTPLVLTIGGAYVVWVYLFAMRYMVQFLLAGTAVAMAAAFGPSMQTLARWGDAGVRWIGAQWDRLVPRTSTGWGVLAVAASFVLLVIGAAVSLLKGKRVEN